MKSVLMLVAVAVIVCHGMKLSSETQQATTAQRNEEATDEFEVNLLPLKILLEYQLRIEEELEEETQENWTKGNLKSLPTLKKDNNANDLCSDTNLMKNLTTSEISTILNNDRTTKGNTISKEQLKKIHNSLRDCFFLKARNSKLWGPLWHCLNRLFLFFVFN